MTNEPQSLQERAATILRLTRISFDTKAVIRDLASALAANDAEIAQLRHDLAYHMHMASPAPSSPSSKPGGNKVNMDKPTLPAERNAEANWPEAVSDGLTLACADCGEVPRFDYHVTQEFWALHVPEKPARLGVICLPCLDRRCGGVGLADALVEIQWTGTKHTVVLKPTFRHAYTPTQGEGE